jgi:hypothetical protein
LDHAGHGCEYFAGITCNGKRGGLIAHHLAHHSAQEWTSKGTESAKWIHHHVAVVSASMATLHLSIIHQCRMAKRWAHAKAVQHVKGVSDHDCKENQRVSLCKRIFGKINRNSKTAIYENEKKKNRSSYCPSASSADAFALRE